jgi:hypothetical protein
MRYRRLAFVSCLGFVLSCASGCSDDLEGHGNEREVITTVALTFSPVGGGTAATFEVDDPDGDGGDPPTIDPISLAPGTSALSVGFENRLEDPAEIITEEVADESDQHQLFFTGTAVAGPASDQSGAPLTQAYDDTDANDLPIGLANTITAVAGGGTLTVTLRHMPPVNEVPVKTADSASAVRTGGFDAIGGSTDAQVSFEVVVQ